MTQKEMKQINANMSTINSSIEAKMEDMKGDIIAHTNHKIKSLSTKIIELMNTPRDHNSYELGHSSCKMSDLWLSLVNNF
jgi:hypothetical protein